MEPQEKKKLWLRRSLVGAGTLVLFLILFFTLGPAVFGQSAVAGISPEESHYAQMFAQVMAFVDRNYVDKVDEHKLFEGAMKGLFESLNDPYSFYLSQSDLMSLDDTTTGEFGGIGLYVEKADPSVAAKSGNPRDKYVEIVAPIEDTPAWKAGILAGDEITKINGQAVDNMTLNKVLDLLRGKAGSEVTLTILRGKATTLTFDLHRAIIQVPSVKPPGSLPILPTYGSSNLRHTPLKTFTKPSKNSKRRATKSSLSIFETTPVACLKLWSRLAVSSLRAA